MQNINYDYFYSNENEQYLFYQLPVMLIKDKRFKNLSDSAKILYSLLLNRTSLSAKNGWRDDEGRVYIIYVIKEIMEDLNCCEQKALKSMKELKEIGLVKTIRRGLNKPNLIYVMNFATDLKYTVAKEPENAEDMRNDDLHSSRNNEKHGSGSMNNNVQKQHISRSSQTYGNKKNFKKIDVVTSKSTSDAPYQNIPLSEDELLTNDLDDEISTNKEPSVKETPKEPVTNVKQDTKPKTKDNPPVYDYDTAKAIIRKNISYWHFEKNPDFVNIKLVDELVENMLDVITSQREKIKINSELKDRQMVIKKYFSLNCSDIQHVVMKYEEQSGKIKHISSYLKTLLYTVKQESNFFYANAVRNEGFLFR